MNAKFPVIEKHSRGQIKFQEASQLPPVTRSGQVKRSCQRKLCTTAPSTARAVARR